MASSATDTDDSAIPAHAAPAVKTRLRAAVLAALLGIVSLGLYALVALAPEYVFSTDWLLGENGNQLFRADQLHRGKSLYADVDCQYGPLPIWVWYGFTHLAGNTVPANLLFQNLLSLVLVGALFWWMTEDAKDKRLVMTIAFILALFTFASTPYLPLLAAPSVNFEYLHFERFCLLALMILWRPPERRSPKHAAALAFLFFVWQCVKVGGGIFGIAAYFAVDVLWTMSCRGRSDLRSLLRWWVLTAIGVMLMEAVRIGLFVLTLGSAQGWRSAWPFYVADDYPRTWLSVWVNLKHFLMVIWPILVLLILLVWFTKRILDGKPHPFGLPFFQAAVGALFYLVSSVPLVGYFGHEWHFFQYQWVLLPLALTFLRLRTWPVLALLLFSYAAPMYQTVRQLLHATPAKQLARVQTVIGPVVAPYGDGRLEMIKRALEETTPPDRHTLIVGTWGGGGWYVAAQEANRPKNIFFSSPSVRRSEDIEEFLALLEQADVVLVEAASLPGHSSYVNWFNEVAGHAAGKILREHFSPLTEMPSPRQAGWMLMLRNR